MCLITTQQTPLITLEDMTVYKTLTKGLMSPYRCHIYERSVLNKTEIRDYEGKNWTPFDEIDNEYLDTHYPNWYKDHTLYPELKCIGQGFHASLTKERLSKPDYSSFWEKKTFECTVPKGSEYYLDATGLIVSNQIIIN